MFKQNELYTVREFLEAAGVDADAITDYRAFKIGGLGFDYLDQQIRIPAAATEVIITEDGETVKTIAVEAEPTE